MVKGYIYNRVDGTVFNGESLEIRVNIGVQILIKYSDLVDLDVRFQG